jgi:Family of unknown function (DUF6338)
VSPSDAPVVILLLLPGFLVVKVYGWVAYRRHVSDFEALLWALICSFGLLVPSVLFWHWLNAKNPSLGSVVRDPTLLRLRVAASMYALAPLAGWLLGQAENRGWIESVLLRVGVDLRAREDIWNLIFRDNQNVIVHLKSGHCICGCVEMRTTSRTEGGPEIYVTQISVWDSDNTKWDECPDIIGTWIDATSIERLELFKSRDEPAPAASESTT